MAGPTQLNINAKGHRYQEAEPAEKDSGTVGEWGGVTLGKILYLCAKSNLKPSVDVGTTIIDTVLEVDTNGAGGNAITLTSVADGAGTGTLGVVGNALTFHFATGVTTIANFESKFPASCTFGIVGVKRASTSGGSTLTAVIDAFGPSSFVRGGTSGQLYKFEGLEDSASAICGMADGTYAQAATATFFKTNGIMPGLAGLTVGSEYYAKHDATLALWSALTSLKWTKRMGVATATTICNLADGEVQLKP